jgi:Carboxypeptidase regulatory-like domain/TonB-dependent Receptor Plug Domain
MLRKLLLLQAVLFFTLTGLMAQTGKISGKIIDAETKESIPFANVIVMKDGVQKGGTVSDFDGKYTITPLVPGEYSLEVSYVGYAQYKIQGVVVKFEVTTRLDINLNSESKVLEQDVIIYAEPLIDPDNTSTGAKMNSKEIEKIPTRSINALAQTKAGVTTADDGGTINLRGARSDGTQYWINGVKMLPGQTPTIPIEAISEVAILTGGIPSQYGDAVGGVISLTTKGPSSRVFGSAVVESSYGLDAQQWLLGSVTLSGPILRAKNENGERKGMTKLGYFVSAQYNSSRDPGIPGIDVYRLKEDVQSAVENNPMFVDQFGTPTYVADTLRASQLESFPYDDNLQRSDVNINTTFDYQASQNITISFGGNYRRTNQDAFYSLGAPGRLNRLMNNSNNGKRNQQQYNIFGRFTQRFGNSLEDDGSTIKNAYYQVQVDYSRNTNIRFNGDFKEDYFKYNSVGVFDEGFEPGYIFGGTGLFDANTNGALIDEFGAGLNPDNSYQTDVYWRDENGNNILVPAGTPFFLNTTTNYYTFNKSQNNPVTGNYTDFVMQNVPQFFIQQAGTPSPYGVDTLPGVGFGSNPNVGLLLNGNLPNQQHQGLYAGVGTPHRNYLKQINEQWRVSALGVMDIKSHSFKFGFEFEQRFQRTMNISTTGIWNAARAAAEKANANLEGYFGNLGGISVFDSSLGTYLLEADEWGEFGLNPRDGTSNNFLIGQRFSSSAGGTFAPNWKNRLGLGPNDKINVDGIDPSLLSLSDFNAEELQNYGGTNNQALSYQGFTYDGKYSSDNSTFSDFFTDTLNRPVAAWQPNYAAFFVEDKFEIKDLIMRVGLRLDRYDVNQSVLKDKYSMVDLQQVGEVNNIGDFSGGNYFKPSTVNDDWVIYVDQDPGAGGDKGKYNVIGYRSDDTWFDVSGREVRSARNISGGNPIYPWFDYSSFSGLKKATFDKYGLTEDAFEDYKPEIFVMPRVSFSFPISEQALFYAHYDVLVQRPSRNNVRADQYFYWRNRGGGTINNANLKPQRNIDYQVGFQQVLTRSSSLRLGAFYRELKDQIGIVLLEGGYPIEQFQTFDNIDYATSKGVTIEYDLRRTNRLSINANYQLSFADGTASGETSNTSLLNLGVDANLRTPIPLNWDERHQVKVNIDYRFRDNDGGKILENSGVNLQAIGVSGRPYTPTGGPKLYSITDARTELIDGSVNSSRKPWNFRVSLRVDKTFLLGNPEIGSRKSLMVYFYIQNLLNLDNIQSVYNWSGSPSTDGYLEGQTGQNRLQNERYPGSYSDIYPIAVNNPSNYGLPRRFRIGASFNF